MQVELSFSQKTLRLIMMLIVAVALALTAFSIFPANGVKSDVIVLFSKQPDGLYARDITSNALIIAQSTLRERKVEGRQIQESYQNIAINSSGGTTFSVNTYGQDEAQNLARENRTALNEILLEVRKHYGSSFPVFFDVVGNTYETARWQLILVIGVISLLLSIYIVSNLFAVFASKKRKDEIGGQDQDQEDQDFNEWYKDKNVLEQISTYDSIAQKNGNKQETVQSQARKSFEQQKEIERRMNEGKGVIWAPQNQMVSEREHNYIEEVEPKQRDTQNKQEVQIHEGQDDNTTQEKRVHTKNPSRKEPSRLAEKWGKGSAADRLRALEETSLEKEGQVQKIDQSGEVFSLASLSKSGQKSDLKKESKNQPQNSPIQSGIVKGGISDAKGKKSFSLPHHRMHAELDPADLEETIVETAQETVSVQKNISSESKSPPQERENKPEKFFEPGGRLSSNPENIDSGGHSTSVTVNAPGNLPIVDVSQFTEQPSERLVQTKSIVDNADAPLERDNNQTQEVAIENDVDFTSEDSQLLMDSEQEAHSNQLQESVVDAGVKIGEPTSEDLKKRLNKLLRGEL